jgi:phage shock protein A
MGTHDDDEAVIQANRFIATSKDRNATELVRQLLNRIGEKKVEMRGLEGQITTLREQAETLQRRVDHLERPLVSPRHNDDTDLNWIPPEGGDPSQK